MNYTGNFYPYTHAHIIHKVYRYIYYLWFILYIYTYILSKIRNAQVIATAFLHRYEIIYIDEYLYTLLLYMVWELLKIAYSEWNFEEAEQKNIILYTLCNERKSVD